MKTYHSDVLIIGGGGAGLRAAIAARESAPDCCVLLATKGILGRSGVTASACSDRMAFHASLEHTEPGLDAWRYHAHDIYDIGGRVSDYDLAEILARGSGEAFRYLQALGVPFVMKDGLPDQFVTDGSQYARACYTGPKTAIHIEEALVRRLRELEIPVVEEATIYRLVKQQGRIAGAFGIGPRDEPLAFSAGAVVLATGGAGGVFRHHVFPEGAAGDGYALALQAGAPLVNMEFIQIGLCSVLTRLACSGSLMRAVPRIVDSNDRELLPGMHDLIFEKGASWPVSCEHRSHAIDVAVFREIARGGHVFLDYRTDPEGFAFGDLSEPNRHRFAREAGGEPKAADLVSPLARLRRINPASIQWLKERGIDLERGDSIEIVPAAQHFQGGVKIGPRADTAVSGLYAAGECAGGQHGANRPGGNSLADCQVFGKIAGEQAARFAKDHPVGTLHPDAIAREESELSQARRAQGDISPAELTSAVRNAMARNVSIVRTREGLEATLGMLEKLKAARKSGGESLAARFESEAMLLTAEAVARAALIREESRGPHLRFDRPDDPEPLPRDPRWERCILVSLSGSGMRTTTQEPVRPQ